MNFFPVNFVNLKRKTLSVEKTRTMKKKKK